MPKDIFETKKQTGSKIIIKIHEKNLSVEQQNFHRKMSLNCKSRTGTIILRLCQQLLLICQ